MVRKATAFALLLLMGLYMPVASMPVYFCLGEADLSLNRDCGVFADSCCRLSDTGANSDCDETECCVVLPGMPDGMEPQLTQAPKLAGLPLPMILPTDFVPLALSPTLKLQGSADSLPPPGNPIRIAFGVWRL